MKLTKLLCTILSLIVLLVMLPSYSTKASISKLNTQWNEPLPQDQQTFHFESYDDLNKALRSPLSNDYATLRNEQELYGTMYEKTLSAFKTGEIDLIIPCSNGKIMDLISEEGYSSISFFTKERYNLPWIWNRCVWGNHDIDVKVCYLNAIDNDTFQSATTYRDILSVISPEAPTPNIESLPETMSAVYEKNVRLADGSTVSVLFYEYTDTEKIWTLFYYNNVLIAIRGEKEVFTDLFWNSFSISKPYKSLSANVEKSSNEDTEAVSTEPADKAWWSSISPWTWVAVVCGSVAVIGTVTLATVFIIRKKKTKS